MPANASATPSHCQVWSRSPGTTKCSPSAVKIGAVYRNTAMREAVVWPSPTKMQKNSAPNSSPASRPAFSVPSRRHSGVPRQAAKPNTSNAATAERTPACSTAPISGAVTLITTCCRPQAAHSTTIRPTAKPSSGCRARLCVLMASVRQGRLASRVEWRSISSIL
ncbi:hypothetical protein D9M72_459660 [compost metagenome]